MIMNNVISFTEKLTQSRSHLIYTLKGKDKATGIDAWWIVQLEAKKEAIFLKLSKKGHFDIKEYGKILESGFGEQPPSEIIEEIRAEYS